MTAASLPPIQRMNDQVFWFKAASEEREVRFHLPKSMDAETRFNLAGKAQKILAERVGDLDIGKAKPLRFRFGNKKWKLIPMNRMNRFLRILYKILAYIFPFFHPPAIDNIARFKIESAWFGQNSKKDKEGRVKRKKLDAEWKKQTGHPFARSNFKRAEKVAALNVSKEEYQRGVRASLSLESQDARQEERYVDPFTTIATLAFQRLEEGYVSYDYRGKERITSTSSDYRFIKIENELKLVHQSNQDLAIEANMHAARSAYIDFIRQEYGDEKVNYISFLYGLDFDKSEGCLTPEHIYRFNIGTTNIEIQDVEQFLNKLKVLDLEKEEGVDKILGGSRLSLNERSGLLKALRSNEEEISLEKLRGWVGRYKDQSCEKMTPQDFNELLGCIFPSDEEMEKAYTGRKIFGMIGSAYTTADKQEYKPWIDQQELTQIFQELKRCPSMASYHELLAHVVSKKHLCRKHPTEGYRVGALIPAPPAEKDGSVRWYKVSSCMSNGYIHSYTLESVCRDESLREDVKFFRSTASSVYAMWSNKSVMSDGNHLNPPGKMGIKLLELHEKKFFNDRTIPVWVAYQHLAAEKLKSGEENLDRIYSLLNTSMTKLVEKRTQKDRMLTFREVLKRHDVILEEFYASGAKILPEKRHKGHLSRFPHLFKQLLKRYGQITEGGIKKLSDDVVKRDASRLQKFLKSIPEDALDAREKLLCHELMQDLDKHVLEPKKINPVATYLEAFDFQMLEKRQQYLESKENAENARKALNEWSGLLHQAAVRAEEDIGSKLARDIAITGHSLGGGCTQGCFTHYLIEEDRAPLPGRMCNLYVFDDTKIDRGANKRLKRFGAQHAELMQELGITFQLFRRQEYGDFVPLGGREHLGATFSNQEMAEVSKWLKFDAAICKRLRTSADRNIAGAKTIHAGRFLKGVPGIDYEETPYSTKEQGIFDNEGRGCPDMSAEESKRLFRALYRDVWGLSSLYSGVLREEERRSTHKIWNIVRRFIMNPTTHKPLEQALDAHGCLAVTLK